MSLIIRMIQKKTNSIIAKCLCGGIKIKVKGKLRHVINCHCSQCMKSHGNYAAYTACLEENIIFINKRSLKWYKSSNFAKLSKKSNQRAIGHIYDLCCDMAGRHLFLQPPTESAS